MNRAEFLRRLSKQGIELVVVRPCKSSHVLYRTADGTWQGPLPQRLKNRQVQNLTAEIKRKGA